MKKGFTLIELLAVIVVLSIILVIAVPRVLNVIESVKKQGFEEDIKNVVKTYDIKLLSQQDPLGYSVTNQKLKDELGLSNENYEYIELTNNNEGIYVIADGKNMWENYVICGTKDNLAFFDDIEECNRFIAEPVYTSEEITAKIALGYIPIATADELNNIRNNTSNTFGLNTIWENTYTGGLDKNYIQVNNINLDVEPYNTGEGWVPIGTYEYSCDIVEPVVGAFEGIYDGGGYKISNLYINRTNTVYSVGLFSTSTGSFYNVIIDQVNVNSGQHPTDDGVPIGALVGLVTGNNIFIDNVKIQGKVFGESPIKYSWFSKIGGLIGYVRNINNITITNSKVVGNIMGNSSYIGGLVGRVTKYNELLLENSSFNGKVFGGAQNIAGLIGEARYEEKSGVKPWNTASKFTIRNCIVNADITGGRWMDNGGLFGEVRHLNDLLVENSTFNGNMYNTFHNTGGLFGRVSKTSSLIVRNSYANGDIVDNYSGRVGGISGTIKEVPSILFDNVHYKGNINSYRDNNPISRMGGLVGSVGLFWDTDEFSTIVNILNCSAKGNLSGAITRVGGLVGALDRNDRRTVDSLINIDNSYYEGNIQTKNPLFDSKFLMLGGLIGAGVNVNINNSYAIGNIYGFYYNPTCGSTYNPGIVTHHAVGGLVGRIQSSANITNSYYVGNIEVKDNGVIQDLNTFDYMNAVVGDKDNATLTSVYYDSSVTSVQDTLAIPKSTINMKNGIPSLEIYTNWDTSIWNFDDTNAYPTFR